MAKFTVLPHQIETLAALLTERAGKFQSGEFIYNSASELVVSERLVPHLNGVMGDPNWHVRGSAVLLRREVGKIRLRREADGVVVGGRRIATDPQSQARLALHSIAMDANDIITWRTGDDEPVRLNFDQARAACVAVHRHLERCASVEAEVIAGIISGEITRVSQIEAAFAAV